MPSIGSITHKAAPALRSAPPPSSPSRSSSGIGVAQARAHQLLDRTVGDAHDVLHPLELDLELRAPVEVVERELAGLSGRRRGR